MIRRYKIIAVTSFPCSSMLVVLSISHIVGTLSVAITEYIQVQENGLWNVSQDAFTIQSLLGCSTECSKVTNPSGFNFIRPTPTNIVITKTCQCILQTDLVPQGANISTDGAFIYIKENSLAAYQAVLFPTTSSTTSTTSSTTSTSTSTSTTTSSTTSTTTTSSTTSTTTTSSTTSTTTTSSTSTTTTPQTTTSTTTSTTEPTTTTSSSTTTTATTTTPQPCPSTVDALVCLDDVIYVFIDDTVMSYDSFDKLTKTVNQVSDISSLFPEVSYPLMSGYKDTSFVYLIKGDDTWKYNKNSLNFISTESTTSLISADGDESDSDSDESDSDSEESDSDSEESTSTPSYDALLQSGPQTFLFQGTNLQIVESGTIVDSVSLSNNGNSNPYKSGNHQDRPTQILAACSIDSDRHIFISDGTVHLFTFSSKVWENLGYFVCN